MHVQSCAVFNLMARHVMILWQQKSMSCNCHFTLRHMNEKQHDRFEFEDEHFGFIFKRLEIVSISRRHLFDGQDLFIFPTMYRGDAYLNLGLMSSSC